MLNKFLYALVITGFISTMYFSFQWWDSTRAVEKVSSEEMSGWQTEGEIQKKVWVRPEVQEVEEPTFSNEKTGVEKGEEVGRLIIPLLNSGYSTYWGTDENALHKGVGMFVSPWTTTPDEKRHTVLSGHRDTVFTKLGDIEKGDSLFFEYEEKRYEYIVEKTWVTDEDDRTVIVDRETPTLTLTTCYPFDFIGSAPERFIVQASLHAVNHIE